MPATSQLDWLISTTAMIVLFWSRATRDLLKSFGWGIAALHRLNAATKLPPPRPRPIESFSSVMPRHRRQRGCLHSAGSVGSSNRGKLYWLPTATTERIIPAVDVRSAPTRPTPRNRCRSGAELKSSNSFRSSSESRANLTSARSIALMTVSISPNARRPTTVPAMAALLAERKVQRRDASPHLPRQSDRRTPGAAGCGLRSRVAHPPRPCPPRQAPVGDVTLLRNEKQTARLAE